MRVYARVIHLSIGVKYKYVLVMNYEWPCGAYRLIALCTVEEITYSQSLLTSSIQSNQRTSDVFLRIFLELYYETLFPVLLNRRGK